MMRRMIPLFKRTIARTIMSVIVLLTICGSATTAFAGNAPALSAANETVAAGSTVQIEVTLTNNPGIIGMTLEVDYDSALTLVDMSNGSAFDALVMTKPGSFYNGCRVHWDATEISVNDIKDGTILKLTFAVAEDARAGMNYAVSVSPVLSNGQPDVFDNSLNTVNLQPTNCEIVVVNHTTGWSYENGSWFYYESDGTLRKNNWASYNGIWYYFGADGKLVTNGWAFYQGVRYYIGFDGKLTKNTWVRVDGEYYYISSDCRPLTSDWASYSGSYYFMDKKGHVTVNNWVIYKGYYFFMGSNGKPIVNQWLRYGDSYYHFNASGICNQVHKTA